MAAAIATPAAAADVDRRLVLVTLDGLPWTEVFRGADPARADDKTFTTERALIRKDFLDPPDRRAALMPFLTGPVAKQGVLLGDRDHGGCAAVANDRWFSYPGYNEILTGRPDPAIGSNAHGSNANVTFLEWLNRRPEFRGKVEVAASWDVFDQIIPPRSGVRVNAGWAGGGTAGPIAALQRDAPRLWPTARLDGFTQAWAMEALKVRKPRVLYVAYDETDDFAHDGRYDQMLWAARRADGFVAELWRTLQADPAYAGKTTLIVTTDHGRGTQAPDAWKHHGPKAPGSDAIWIAAIGPGVRAGAAPVGCASQSQIAATALKALGLDVAAFDPRAGAPLEIFR
ncbi:MAG: alkaline phosphatase family protein [Phenylobacterium sp.]|uniref:alkaline phosphatase family protein n=1 Tax=Phenylobacterium sp. TaxID=1871053 RepID=UPI001A545121|nr:alkaline phosphatase family protein [Phenylobacterium sp.]MBL8554262.1 alkaline phosphatase family protein [Phenylobacterium sp.]